MASSGLWDTAAKKILVVLSSVLVLIIICILGEVVYANLLRPSMPASNIESTNPVALNPMNSPTTWIPLVSTNPIALPQNFPPTWTPFVSANNGLSSHGCRINGPYPDTRCTPGAVFNVLAAQICVSGYSQSVRDVSESTKNQVYASYGINAHAPGQYEVDHFIPLELGGSNDINNLFPEAAEPKPGFHEKDKVENYLHDQVCSGAISLRLAQDMIREDWVKVYSALASAPIPTFNSQPTSKPPSQGCCMVCTGGKACGDSCISKSKTCTKPPGCACQGP